ncbi:hypothetical protein POVWA2_015770 [Plasmodium ovale wallikeri]|uniref:Uncharacterized protein n=1 Tax=Plasmodium ovale wallikeri TaxID=864142 RepID=A0A1A8YP21_PLAOA|nr:hypothetical protein POVWA1_016270 [Plasmodium ovale wallikeri]SBT33630.1 hypothetical protein POVWA2_015770 [Plasmodium ovale wallikeri]
MVEMKSRAICVYAMHACGWGRITLITDSGKIGNTLWMILLPQGLLLSPGCRRICTTDGERKIVKKLVNW